MKKQQMSTFKGEIYIKLIPKEMRRLCYTLSIADA